MTDDAPADEAPNAGPATAGPPIAGPPTAGLAGWAKKPFTGAGITYDCYEKGSGPGIVLIPEIPGLSPEVMGLAEHLVAEGFTVVVPSPFGTPGRAATPGYVLKEVARVCVTSEFRAFAMNAHRPVTEYFRAVANDLADRTPGNGVGVIGMCITGGFGLALAIDDSVRASVLSQPSLPLPLGARRANDIGVSPAEMDRIVERAQAGEVCTIGLRFTQDKSLGAGRFKAIKDRLGDAFEMIELDSSPGNIGGFGKSAHSVITSEVRVDPPNMAYDARKRVVEFMRERLTVAA